MTVFKNDNGGGNRGGRVAVLRSTNRGDELDGPDHGQPARHRRGDGPRDRAIRSGPATSSRRSRPTSGRAATTSTRSGRTPASTGSSATRSRSRARPTAACTWSTPVRISRRNDTQAFTPAIRVDGDGQHRRHVLRLPQQRPGHAGARDRHVVHALDRRRATWSEERVTPTLVRHADGAGGARVLHRRLRGPDRPRRRLLVAVVGVARVDRRVVGAPDLAVRGAELHAVDRTRTTRRRRGRSRSRKGRPAPA